MAQEAGIQTHIITSYYAVPLMVTRQQGLIIEITDGNHLGYNSSGVFFSLTKTSAILLAYLMSEELRKHNVAVVSLTPGWMRSEEMLDNFGVSEENWKDVLDHIPSFVESETPFYVGRAVVGLATDPKIIKKTGFTFEAAYLAREYDFMDIDGKQKPIHILPGVFKNGGFAHMEKKPRG